MPAWDKPCFEYATGREQARIGVIKEIYTKYYRRKFANGNFRASWIPDSDKLERIYRTGRASAVDDTTKCQLITLNPHDAACIVTAEGFLIDVLEHIRGKKNLISRGAEFCIEHRGTEKQMHGVHVHLWHDNLYGVARSEVIRRFIAAFEQVRKGNPRYSNMQWSNQSIDVKERPMSSCKSYIRKNKDSDTFWGYGFQGLISQDLNTVGSKIAFNRAHRRAEVEGIEEAFRRDRERLNIFNPRRTIDLSCSEVIPESDEEPASIEEDG